MEKAVKTIMSCYKYVIDTLVWTGVLMAVVALVVPVAVGILVSRFLERDGRRVPTGSTHAP